MRRFLALCAFLFGLPAWGLPAVVQTCKSVNGGTATQNYIVTIAGSGGTTGCTSNFTSGNMLAIAYDLYQSTDITTSAISVTGATVTWSKAVSLRDSVFNIFWSGIFYACPSSITSPTSSIQITVNMGALVKNTSAIYVHEISGIQSSSCFNSITGSNTAGTCPTATNGISTGSSGTLSASPELILVSGSAFDSNGCTGVQPVSFSAGTAAGTSSFGNFTIPSQGQDNEINCIFGASTNVDACGSYTEYVVVSSTASGVSYASASSGIQTQLIVHAGFIGLPAATGHGPKGKIL